MLSFPDARPIPTNNEVMLECMMGGKWNVHRIPECSRELALSASQLHSLLYSLLSEGHLVMFL